MSTGSARPLEDAFRIAHGDLVRWLAEEHALDTLDAYQLVSQIAESPVANVCDPNYTFVAKAPKRFLPSGDVYGSIRAHLVEVAGRYLGERARS
jgi:acetamidase/formamidase